VPGKPLRRLLPTAPLPPLRASEMAVAIPSRSRVIMRGVRILWVAARFSFGWWLDQQSWSYSGNQSRREREIKRARWLKDRLVNLGPTFIKIGQALSTRVDLLPLSYVDEMAVLQDRIPPFDTALARQFIEQELGRPVGQIFRDFPIAPFAAASLGQVYHTWLPTGEEVAVKVQRPELLETFAVDLAVLRYLAHYVEAHTDWLPGVELLDILDEFGRKLHEEVDYQREADNADRFRNNFQGFQGVAVPLMYRAYSSRRVLTMEFMHGFKITDVKSLSALGIDPHDLVMIGARVNLKQLLEDGFYHADLHPGNILVDRLGRLIFVDFGLVGEIARSLRAQMVEAFLHIVDKNVDALVQDLRLLGFIRPGQDAEPIKPTLAWIIDVSLTPSEKRPTFKEMTDPMADIFYRYHLRVPVTFSFIFRTVISLEGIGMLLDPTFHPFDVVIPYAAKLMLSEAGADIRERLATEIFTPAGLDWQRLFELVELARRDPGFRLSQVAGMGVEWLFSQEGRSIRDKLLDELLSDDPIPWDAFERLIDLAQSDPAFDLMRTMGPLVNYLLTPEAAALRQRLLWKIGKDIVTGRIGEWAGAYKLVRALL
jgi:predicted unusual protein kinase regulating ubiquinone biosynthesis (AarF/ABC1/UbiB family)